MSIVAAYALPHPPLIIPEIGRGEERKIRNTIAAYMEVSRRIALLDPDVIVISTPHSVMYQNYIHISPGTKAGGDFGRFGCPDVGFMVDYDSELASLLSAKAIASEIAAGMEGEREKSLDHGVMVPLFFIKKNLQDFKLVRISLSGLSLLDHYRLGRLVQEATEELNRKVVFIGSGDLSHKLKINGPYGFAPEGPAFDKLITDILESGDFDRLLSIDQQLSEKAAECGLRSFAMMAGALDGKDIEKELLSYEGPFGVGYAVMAYAVTADNPNRSFAEKEANRLESEIEDIRVNEDEFVHLARMSLEYYQKNHKHLPKPSNLGVDLLSKKGGVFVSIKLDGQLRGCIGTIAATTDSLADEIIQNAVSAGFRDPRFDHVSKSELARLVYSVDVLEKAEPVSSMLDLDPKRYGIIVRCKGKSGLLLPDLEGVDTPEEQLKIALRKGNISPEDDYHLERFVVTRHH